MLLNVYKIPQIDIIVIINVKEQAFIFKIACTFQIFALPLQRLKEIRHGKIDLLIHTPNGASLKDSRRFTPKSLDVGLGRLAIVNNARY